MWLSAGEAFTVTKLLSLRQGSQAQSHGHRCAFLPADRRSPYPALKPPYSEYWVVFPGKNDLKDYKEEFRGLIAFACICDGILCLGVNVLKPNVNLAAAGREFDAFVSKVPD